MIRRVKKHQLASAVLLIVMAQSWHALPEVYKSRVSSIRGFLENRVRSEKDWEEKLRKLPSAEHLRENMKLLSAEPHHAGSGRTREIASYLLSQFRQWGLSAVIEEFEVLLPTPVERVVELISPSQFQAKMKEPAISEDPDSSQIGQIPTFNAYSAEGDVTGELVYVNYGIPEDYQNLKNIGIEVKGKIVLVRYGVCHRGVKPKLATEHGAVGCLIYSDPQDDGYYQGDVYPVGAYRPEEGVQRGSANDRHYPGDPLTPGWASEKGAPKLKREEATVFQKIPVLPLSYGDALPLLKSLKGPVAPGSWRGALPITYHIGPGPGVVRVKVSFEWSVKPVYDVIARIEGTEYPNEWVLYGNHHDAWVNGATDPVSGAGVLLETARSLGELIKQGWSPKRTIIFALWDAEEWGLVGSTEWVEKHAAELQQKAVAYLNSDSTGKGPLRLEGCHSLGKFINEVVLEVPDPKRGKSLWHVLKAQGSSARKEVSAEADIRIAALGSGSDYTAFLDHLGIAALNLNFASEGSGVYHSIYDTFHWYTQFSDSDFLYGRALSQIMGISLMRLANADVLPFDYVSLAEAIVTYVDEIEVLYQKVRAPQKFSLAALRRELETLRRAADAYEKTLQMACSHNRYRSTDGFAKLSELNRLLYQLERLFLPEKGLPRREWFKHRLYAPGVLTGYDAKTIPGIREAIEQGSWEEARRELAVFQGVLARVIQQTVDCERKLRLALD